MLNLLQPPAKSTRTKAILQLKGRFYRPQKPRK